MKIKATARRAAETMLRSQAKPIRKLLLATGRDRSPILPEIVQIESTNICNAKCVFCPRDDMHRRQGVMSLELFRKVVDEGAELGITHVRAHNYGEPVLDRHLIEKVRYATERGIEQVGMISNGSPLTEEAAPAAAEARPDQPNLTVAAHAPEGYDQALVGLRPD